MNFSKNMPSIPSDQKWDFFLKSFVSGGIAGMVSKTAVAPLDRIKILLQVHHSTYKHLGVFSGLKGIVKNESFLALYRGNGAQMVRIFPYASVQFFTFELYKKGLNNLFPSPKNETKHSLKFCAGSLAGVSAASLTYPLDLIRARLAYNVVMAQSNITSVGNGSGVAALQLSRPTIAGTLVSVFKNEGGLNGLYRGLTPTLVAMVPYSGFSFYFFELLKHFSLTHMPEFCAKEVGKDKQVLNVPSKLVCGGVAGAIAQTVSYPLDVTRRRMQLSMTTKESEKYSKNPLQTLKLIYEEQGIKKGLYRGMSVNYIRAIPMVAVSFSTYELCKQFFGLSTGVDS